MSVYRIQYGGIVGKPTNYSEFLCDSIEDINMLPTNSISTNIYGICSIGSIAYVNGIKYILNNNGVWEELQHLDDEDIDYESAVNSLIDHSFTKIDDMYIYKISRSKLADGDNNLLSINSPSITTINSTILNSSLANEFIFQNLIDYVNDDFIGGYTPNVETIYMPNLLRMPNFNLGIFPKLKTLNLDRVFYRGINQNTNNEYTLSELFDYSSIIEAIEDENNPLHDTYSTLIGSDTIPSKAPITNLSIKYWKKILSDEFKDMNSLESIDAEYVTECEVDGNNPFAGCINLKSVNINNVKNACDSIFKNCSQLEELYCKNLAIIPSNMCHTCKKLTKIDSNATSVGANAFRSCNNLKDINLPNAINIDASTFKYCTSLESISLPNAISIGGSAFSNCNILKDISLPNVTSIGDSAFYYCTSITDINLRSATNIGNYAFLKCTSLTDISLPNATDIGENAFSNCTSLIDISLPSATSIGNSAFNDCTNLTDVILPNATNIGENAFSNCSSLTDISLPSATNIGNSAFNDCTNLTDISLPSATSIGYGTFSNCTSLIDVILPNVTSIGNAAFAYCISLTAISLPNVTSIGNSAFTGCSSLTDISLPNVTSIGYSAFQNCTNLTTISLPNATTITNNAFYNCTNLEDIYLPNAQNTYSGAPWGAVNATIHYECEFNENGTPLD